MPRLKLTQCAVEKLSAPDPAGKQTLHWDTEIKGFGVLCSGTTKAKTYVVQRDMPGGRTRRMTIAPTNVIALDEARRRAESTLADLYRGVDPKLAARGTATLRATLDAYLEARKDLRPASIRSYHLGVERYLAP